MANQSWRYYGQKDRGTTKPLKPGHPRIATLDDLFEILFHYAWAAETAETDLQDVWKEEIPADGQSAVTALLVHDLFGGEILCPKKMSSSYYFNQIDGVIVDLASHHLDVMVHPGRQVEAGLYVQPLTCSREQCLQTDDLSECYQKLVHRIVKYLKKLDSVETQVREKTNKESFQLDGDWLSTDWDSPHGKYPNETRRLTEPGRNERPLLPYYGQEERGKTKRLRPGDPRIETIDDLYEILFRYAWIKETAYPRCQEDWDEKYPAYGQCAVTALLVYDLFGGEIRSNESHYFNKIDGVIVDVTSQQDDYPVDPVLYEHSRKRYRDQCGQTGHTKKRYQLLVQRVADYLKKLDSGEILPGGPKEVHLIDLEEGIRYLRGEIESPV